MPLTPPWARQGPLSVTACYDQEVAFDRLMLRVKVGVD